MFLNMKRDAIPSQISETVVNVFELYLVGYIRTPSYDKLSDI